MTDLCIVKLAWHRWIFPVYAKNYELKEGEEKQLIGNLAIHTWSRDTHTYN